MTYSLKIEYEEIEDYIYACTLAVGEPYDIYRPWEEDETYVNELLSNEDAYFAYEGTYCTSEDEHCTIEDEHLANESAYEVIETESNNHIIVKLVPKYTDNSALRGFRLYSGTDFSCMYYGEDMCGICTVFSYVSGGRTVFELYCLTHPSYRLRGIGSALIRYTSEHIANHFSTSGSRTYSRSSDSYMIYLVGPCREFALRTGGYYSHSEHFMLRSCTLPVPAVTHEDAEYTAETLNGEYIEKENADNIPAGETHNSSCNDTPTPTPAPTPALRYRLLIDGETVCRCQTDILSDCVNISHVYTGEDYRRKGYATALMYHIASLHPDKDLLLQVSGNNTPAIRTYQKAGFDFLQTTDYYVMAV